jgi:hypothetical protein
VTAIESESDLSSFVFAQGMLEALKSWSDG